MERLFSTAELTEIETDASSNLEYYLNTVVSNGQATERSIITISKNKHLIFVEGNTDTGFQHLRERHDFFSYKNYWIENDDKVLKLDNPSKFNPRMMPIVDFVSIAEAVFSEDNKNITKNKNPDLFDKYTGTHCYSDQQAEKYHLITYKDTKIVHSLFPDKKKHNIKNKSGYGKGNVTTSLKFPEGINDLLVPYENSEGVIAYSILIRKFLAEQTERLFIQKHNKEGIPEELYPLGYRKFNGFERFNQETIIQFQTADLADLENLIYQIDNEPKTEKE